MEGPSLSSLLNGRWELQTRIDIICIKHILLMMNERCISRFHFHLLCEHFEDRITAQAQYFVGTITRNPPARGLWVGGQEINQIVLCLLYANNITKPIESNTLRRSTSSVNKTVRESKGQKCT